MHPLKVCPPNPSRTAAVWARAAGALLATTLLTMGLGSLSRASDEESQTGSESQTISVTLGADESGARIAVDAGDSDRQKIRILSDDEPEEDATPADETPGERWEEDEEPWDIGQRRPEKVRGYSEAEDKVAIGDIRIDYDEVIRGNVLCVFGSARIHGTVRGDVVALGGDVEVGPTGLVRGEALAIGGGDIRILGGGVVEGQAVTVGGRVRQDDEALVGERVEISFIPAFAPGFGAAGFLWLGFLAHLFIVGFAGWLFLNLSRMRTSISTDTLRVRGWESLLAGVGGAIIYHIVVLPLLLILGIVLVAIVIGIPLIPVLVLLVLMFPVPGYLVTSTLLGLSASGSSSAVQEGPEGAVPPKPRGSGLGRAYFLGHVILSLPGLVSLILAMATGGPGLVSKSLLLLSIAIINLAIALGWGAILLSRFGRRAPAARAAA